MDEKQVKTIKRVVKKLNTLRATLTKPESAILDSLIVREAEVTGHSMLAPAKVVASQASTASLDGVQADGSAATEAVLITLTANGYLVANP